MTGYKEEPGIERLGYEKEKGKAKYYALPVPDEKQEQAKDPSFDDIFDVPDCGSIASSPCHDNGNI